MSTKRRPKRKVKVSIKYNDTVCDLTKKKSRNQYVTSDEEVETERVEDLVVNGVSRDDTYCSSMEYNAYDTEFPSLNKQNELNNKDCNNKELSKENVEEANSSSYDNGVSNNNTEKVSEPKDDVNKNDKEMESNIYKTFANMMRSDNDENENKLNQIPLCVEDGREVVILDEELVKEGSRKWSLTLCGHFVGYKMTYYELRYNLVRMWGKYGLKEIVTQNGVFPFKFRESDGMEFVLENGSWMVNDKSLMVQKWDHDVVIDISEPKTLPCWIKLHNVPLNAWTSNGISAIASGLGKPLIMDKTTTKMCRGGIGNFRYARVLVEIQADKEFKDKIKICYRNNTQRTKCSEFVKVEYSWKPLKCCESKVFGHTENTCGLKSGNECIAKKGVWNKKNDKEDNGFRKVRYGNNNTKPAAKKENLKALRLAKQGWSTGHKENIEELRRSANKFSILEEIHDCEDPEEQMLIEKEIMDKFVKNQRQPTIEDSSKWTAGMFKYFKEQWKSKWINECLDEEDVFDEVNGILKKMTAWNVRGKERKILWKDLASYRRMIDNKPWVLMGDWNHIEVEDLNSSGIHFTWIQSRQDHSSGILKKIDRVLGNIEFMSCFSNSHALFLPHLTFDHSPAVLIIPKVLKKKHKAFRFSNFIADKLEFISIVQDHWNTNVEGCHMYKLVKRMKGLKYHMKKFSWKFGNIFEKVIEWKEKLQIIQRKVYQDPHNATLKKHEADILKEYCAARKDEEKLLLQKANSKFFHSVIKGSEHRSRIEIVNDKNGVRYEGDQVAEQFTVYVEDAEIMVMHVSDMEIKEALFDICDNKAPGLDGYSAKFFKYAWSVIKNEVCDVVKEFFRTGKMLGEINATLITLVPKSKTPEKLSDYRPIACCNTIYKVISKILTNRIKSALLLCHRDLNFVKVVKRALDLFSSISGLNQNIGKVLFFGNVKDQVTSKKGKLKLHGSKFVSQKMKVVLVSKISAHEMKWWGPVPLINNIPMEAICQVGLDPNSKIKDMISAVMKLSPGLCGKLMREVIQITPLVEHDREGECRITSKLWRSLKKQEKFDFMPDNWDAIMAAMTQLRHNRSIKSVLRRIILAACVYFIWNERNKRLFTSDKKDSNDLTAEIVNYVRLKLTSLTVKRTSQTEKVCKLWKVVLDMKLNDILLGLIDIMALYLDSFQSFVLGLVGVFWPWGNYIAMLDSLPMCIIRYFHKEGFLVEKGRMNLVWQGKLKGIKSHERWDFLVHSLSCKESVEKSPLYENLGALAFMMKPGLGVHRVFQLKAFKSSNTKVSDSRMLAVL
ncbi:RNA-directed DNA polymerase, eukaryota, reverse transcriptase zinc-binding domain protein [Tanacetum coccineum]